MRECLHIFRKDVRRLWPFIAAMLAVRVLGLYILMGVNTAFAGPFVFLLPFGNCLLLALLIQEESPANDDQFWLTRPYHRSSLLAAKVLFALAFVNVPFFISDLTWFWHDGLFSPAAIRLALWRQVLLVGWSVLGAAAIAAVSRNLVQFLFGGLVLVAATGSMFSLIAGIRTATDWGAVTWIRGCLELVVFAAAAMLVVWWQYRRRGLFAARGIVIGTLLIVTGIQWLAPFSAAYALQARLRPASAPVCAELDVARPLPSLPSMKRRERKTILVELPVKLSGVPPGQTVISDALDLEVNGHSAGWNTGNSLRETPAGYVAVFSLDRSWFERASGGPGEARVGLALTLFADASSAGITACTQWTEYGAVFCRSLDPSVRMLVGSPAGQRRVLRTHYTYGPEPWAVELIPYTSRSMGAYDGRMPIITQRAVGHLETGFTMPGSELRKFVLPEVH